MKEYSENDFKQLDFQKTEEYHVPAKYTIEMECANQTDTCQPKTKEEDNSPAVVQKTGVIDVISENYKFEKDDFNKFGKDSGGLKIYHLDDGL